MTLPAAVAKYTPDVRISVMIGLFGLSYKLLNMVEHLPSLLNSAPFMTMATLVLGGSGLGAVVFLFGGTKTGADVMKQQSDTLSGVTPDTTKTQTTTIRTEPPAPLEQGK